MKNPFQTAPRCVQWAAVTLVALPVFNTIVALGVMPFARFISLWQILLPNLGVLLLIAAGLLYGINLVRLLFAGLVILMTASEVVGWYSHGFSAMSLVSAVTARVLPCIALGLCFLPAANRYFSGKVEPDPALEDEAAAPKTAIGPAAKIVLLVVVLIGGVFLLKRFAPALQNASSMSREQKAAHASIMQGAQDTQIGYNLRMLITAYNQYALDHGGETAKYSDLVGPDKFITQLSPVAGERYPEEYSPGTDPVAVMPDGTILSYDQNTFKTVRTAPSSSPRAKPAPAHP
jgi:hypothetical protein